MDVGKNAAPRRRVSVVILHYRRGADAFATIDSVLAQTDIEDVLLVDNASGDMSARLFERSYPRLNILHMDVNDGFAAGMNAGIAHIKDPSDLVLLLSHDAVIPIGGIATLAAAMDEDPIAGLAGPMVVRTSTPNRLWSQGGAINNLGRPIHPGQNGPVPDRLCGTKTVDWVEGAIMMVRRAAFDRVGGLCEDYFLYCEEVDFALRLKAEGYTTIVVPSVLTQQEPAGCMPSYLDVRNRVMMWRKHHAWLNLAKSLVVCLVQIVLDCPRAGLKPSWRRGARLVGVIHAFTGQLDRRLATLRQPEAAKLPI